jgi:hypothetical protein
MGIVGERRGESSIGQGGARLKDGSGARPSGHGMVRKEKGEV